MITVSYHATPTRRVTRLYQGKVEVGRFELHRMGGGWSMSIHIDPPYQGQGYARALMHPALLGLDDLLFVDVDASNGFWERMGLRPHRYAEYSGPRDLVGKGYEKMVESSALLRSIN